VYGYSQLSANRTHLRFVYFHNDDDSIADEFVLVK
jgi:hypothetical protein